MEKPAVAPVSKTSPKDFFLWLGAIIALYGSVISLITLLFEYVNYAFPDALAGYGDPYGGAIRAAMAAVIVLVPTMLVLLRIIRGTIVAEPGKANIWVRRWALVLTLFIAVITILIDLITLINTFLGGEISVRFELKAALILLIALGVFLHFLADLKGYWISNPKRGNRVGFGVAVLAVAVIASGFFLIGSPTHVRNLRFDDQKVSDLQNLQYQIINYWQIKHALPAHLPALLDSVSGNTIPQDPQSDLAYTYKVVSPLKFQLCATFNLPTPDTAGKGGFNGGTLMPATYPSMMADGTADSWQHGAGTVCFDRTIDPQRYPPTPTDKAVPPTKGL
jgi:hypothetical protein